MEEASPLLDDGKPKATIGEPIGRGGYGYVFSGAWDDGKRNVKGAFKNIPIKVNFEEEKQFLENNRLGHMFIVKYLGTTNENSIEYLVLELCDGNLKEFVESGVKNKQIIDSRSVLSQVVVGLGYLHGQKIIHKDLKPNNILYQHKEDNIILCKLCDFGYSRKMLQGEFKTTGNRGTDGYIAPELDRTGKPTFATDIWALGAVCFFVVSKGQHPYEIPELNNRHVQVWIDVFKTAPGLEVIADDWAALDLINRLLHYQPENRPNIFTIIYHPFFALTNEMTKKHLAFKIFDFWINKHDGKFSSSMNNYFNERNLKEWYHQYEKELGSEGDQKELERISNFLKSFDVNPSTVTAYEASKKVKSEISRELHHSAKVQRVICPEFSQILELLETGIKLFPLYVWHVLKSLPLSDEAFREHFQVGESEYGMLHFPIQLIKNMWNQGKSTEEMSYLMKIGACISSPEILKFLVTNGGDVNWRDQEGRYLIHYAARLNHEIENIQFLLDFGADINAPSRHGSPLHFACFHGNRKFVENILDRGADIKAVNESEDTALHWSASFNADVDVTALLIERGADVHAIGYRKRSAILQAAGRNPNPKVLKCLFENGGDLNQVDEHGNTALHLAALYTENIEVVRFLIENGADVHATGFKKQSAFLQAACRNPNPKVLKCLFENGGDIKQVDEHGNTALHLAAQFNENFEIAQFLIEKGADIRVTGFKKQSAFLRAAMNPNPKVVQYLFAKSGNKKQILKQVDEDGTNALHLAARFNENVEVIRFLIKEGVDVHATGFKKQSAFLQAAGRNQNSEVVEYLLENGGDLKQVDEDGNTALHLAARFNANAEITRFLLEKGADRNAINNSKQTPQVLPVIMK